MERFTMFDRIGLMDFSSALPQVECTCAGSPFEMGIAQGMALGSKIKGAWDSLSRLEAFRLEQPWWMPYRVFGLMASSRACSALMPPLRSLAPQMAERLTGVAEGAGLPLRKVALLNAMEAFLSSINGRIQPMPTALPGACSALAVRGARSISGEPVVAKNFDYLPITQPYFTMRISRPQKGFASLEFLVGPQAGCVDGLNEEGLTITLNYAFMKESGAPAPLITMLIADALGHCRTVAEAVDRLRKQKRWGAGLLMLADAEGNLASVELSSSSCAVRKPSTEEDFLVHTNVCSCAESIPLQVEPRTVFSGRVPKLMAGKPVLEWHANRAARIKALVNKAGAMHQDEIAGIMADHGSAGVPDGSSPCVHTEYWRTTASLLWFPRRRKVRVSYSTACVARYMELSL